MYLLPIAVPLFRDGDRVLVHTDWRRALELLRDSLGGRYGDVRLLSPHLPADGPEAAQQTLEPLDQVDGVEARPVYDARVRARQFWLRESRAWRAILREELPRAQVVHAGLDELYRPMMGMAFAQAAQRGVPTVFVQDTDVVLQVPELAGPGALSQVRARLYARVYEKLCRRAVQRADLVLMKGGTLARRYGPYAPNLRVIENTSYHSDEIVPHAQVQERLASQRAQRPLRLVYCGRLIERKGVHESLALLAAARDQGARYQLDVIGTGPERTRLERLAEELGLSEQVCWRGSVPYGRKLLAQLSDADAMFFTPTAEDTPRMIFDGYAAGLPLIASAIPYVEERARAEGSVYLLPRGDRAEAVRRLVALDRNRSLLLELTRAARQAAEYHSADAWYQRRAEWTHEAVARRSKSLP